MPLKCHQDLGGAQWFLVQGQPLVPRPLHPHHRPSCHNLVLVPALCPGSGKQSNFRGTDLGWGLGGFVSSVSTSEGRLERLLLLGCGSTTGCFIEQRVLSLPGLQVTPFALVTRE